jgi:hypothetical protein
VASTPQLEEIMSTGAIIGIIIAAVVVVAIVVVASAQLRRARIRRQFGPEYDRMAQQMGARKADAELAARRRRVESLDLHPLTAEQQAVYSSDWAVIQENFVDAPGEAVNTSRTLVWAVMRDRGYPATDENASMEALSYYHAGSYEGYRPIHDLPTGSATTEQLRDAMIRYRALFEDLTGLREGPAQPGAERVPTPAAASDHGALADQPAENRGGTAQNRAVAESHGVAESHAVAEDRAVAEDAGLPDSHGLPGQRRDLPADSANQAAR